MSQVFPEAGQSSRETISFAPVAAGATLELFLMAKGPQPAAVVLRDVDSIVGKVETRRRNRFERQRIAADTPVDRLSYDPATTALSVVYAYDPASVLDTGIRILHGGPAATPEALRGYLLPPRPMAG